MLVTFLFASPAVAQCTGDCNGSGTVTVDELVLGTNIALDKQPLSRCLAFDPNEDHNVRVNELVEGVNNLLHACPAVFTPTPTPSVPRTNTPTRTGTPPTATPTATVPPGCGDGHVDFAAGETCDDGNTLDGDQCPANCRIATCTSSGMQRVVDVSFTPPDGVDVAGLTVFLRYPESQVRIPGQANDQSVQDRISNLPGNAFATPNDLDYALRVVMLATDSAPFPPGLLLSVAFDDCRDASAPGAEDFVCVVEDASDPDLHTVTGVQCTIMAPATPTHGVATDTPSPTGTATEGPSVTATTAATATIAPTDTVAVPPTATNPPSTNTPTRTAAATASPTPTATSMTSAVCGNGVIEPGETCEGCATDCVVHACTAVAPTHTVNVNFTAPAGADVSGLTLLVGYKSSVASIPGSMNVASVAGRVKNRPSNAIVSSFDLDYALRVVLSRPNPFSPGRVFTVELDGCQGAAVPQAPDFACTVAGCANTFGNLNGCACTVTLP